MYNFREQCQSVCVVCLSLVYSIGKVIIKHIIRFGFGAPYFIKETNWFRNVYYNLFALI